MCSGKSALGPLKTKQRRSARFTRRRESRVQSQPATVRPFSLNARLSALEVPSPNRLD
jgi:hypothetical protein